MDYSLNEYQLTNENAKNKAGELIKKFRECNWCNWSGDPTQEEQIETDWAIEAALILVDEILRFAGTHNQYLHGTIHNYDFEFWVRVKINLNQRYKL